jgi:hypothetical protein
MLSLALVVISDPKLEERTFGANVFTSQTGFLQAQEGESLKIEISLPRGHGGYPAGRYYIAGASFDRDNYGRPCFGKRGLHLLPAPAASKA